MSVYTKKLLVSAACLLTAGGLVLPEAFARLGGTAPGGTSSGPSATVEVRTPANGHTFYLPLYGSVDVTTRYSLSDLVAAGYPLPPYPGEGTLRIMHARIGEVTMNAGPPGSPIEAFDFIPHDFDLEVFDLDGRENYDFNFSLDAKQGKPASWRTSFYYFHGYVEAKVLLNSGDYETGVNHIFFGV